MWYKLLKYSRGDNYFLSEQRPNPLSCFHIHICRQSKPTWQHITWLHEGHISFIHLILHRHLLDVKIILLVWWSPTNELHNPHNAWKYDELVNTQYLNDQNSQLLSCNCKRSGQFLQAIWQLLSRKGTHQDVKERGKH